MLIIRKLNLYFHTLKYLKPSQFWHRGKFIVKRKLYYNFFDVKKKFEKQIKTHMKSTTKVNNIIYLSNFDGFALLENEHQQLLHKLSSLKKNEFTFLNKTIQFGQELGWHNEDISQLWRYNLHYFDYARDLGIGNIVHYNDIKIYEVYKSQILSWIDNNQKVGIGDGWHPYTISLRLVNWIFSYSLFKDKIDKDQQFQETLVKSIFLQSLFLLKNLEYDVYGNHLFENAKTLIIAGLFLKEYDCGSSFLSKGENILKSELKEQILCDGGHFERSPMYHCIVLKGLVELLYAYQNSMVEIPHQFLLYVEKMAGFLVNIIHPDREIPLFNDSAFGIANTPDYLLSYMGIWIEGQSLLQLSSFDRLLKGNLNLSQNLNIESEKSNFIAEESGYIVSRDQFSFLIFDFGKPCPDYLPAHAHSDIFSFELSVGRDRFIIDTGTYEYAQGAYRNFNRSTKAHNTVTYKDADQSRVWGSFRVAERANVKTKTMLSESNVLYYCGSHNGYKKSYGINHFRHFYHVKDKAIVILDEIVGVEALKSTDVKSYVHLEPSIVFDIDKRIAFSKNNSIKLVPIQSIIGKIEKGEENPLQGWYSPEFGLKIPNITLAFSPLEEMCNYFIFGYAILLNTEIEFKKIAAVNEGKFGFELIEKKSRHQFCFQLQGVVVK